MAVTASSPVREHEKPMSWARAILIAVGFFFVTAILLGQLPSYIYTVSTLSTLQTFEQSVLSLALLALGLGLICFEVVWLYDPKPLLPWPLFALGGLVIAAIGLYIVIQVSAGSHTTSILGVQGWDHLVPSSGYLIHPAWFQANSIDLGAVGMIALFTGLGMLLVAMLTPAVLSRAILGPARDLIVRFCLGAAIAITAAWGVVYTFVGDSAHSAGANVVLFIALLLALTGLITWLLPVMTANRDQFMPATYLFGVVGLIGMVAVPLLVIWAIAYPLVNLIHQADADQFWVQCSQKVNIPGSCTFTQFTGYIICAIVFSGLFALLIAGIYFWSTRRNTVVFGGTLATVFLALAVVVIHTGSLPGEDGTVQLPFGLVMAVGIVVLAFIYTWATQREFAPTSPMALGCTGQWLVLGTLMLFFLLGYAFFSLPTFFELESGLAMLSTAGNSGLHDAFWTTLLMLGFAVFQLVVLARRKQYPMGKLRLFALWTLLFAVVLIMAGAIQTFHHDVLAEGINGIEGPSALVIAGLCFGIAGVATSLFGAFRMGSTPWMVAIVVCVLLGIAIAIVGYTLPYYPEITIAGFIIALVGGFAYVAAGLDPEQADELAYQRELAAQQQQ